MHETILRGLRRWSLAVFGTASLVGTASAGPPADAGHNLLPSGERPAITRRQTPLDDSGLHRQERQACLSGRSNQDRSTCLEEVRNAQAARERGELALAGEDYMANALARCEPLAGEERASCEARVLGFGNASGSVAGGGLLRWVETVVLPPSEEQVTFAPRTAEPVVVIPSAAN